MGGSSGSSEQQTHVRSDFDEEGQCVELEFEAVKRVKTGEEHRWTALVGEEEGLF